MRDQHPFFRKRFHPTKVLFFLVMAALLLAVAGQVIKFLWNFTLPELIGVRPISFWQAVALFVLFRLFFGGFGWRRYKDRAQRKRRYWKDKWMNMDPAERDRFKNKWKEHCDRKKS